MAVWIESAMMPGDWLRTDLTVRARTFARVRPYEGKWVVCETSGVIHAGPFETKEAAMLAAELMFE